MFDSDENTKSNKGFTMINNNFYERILATKIGGPKLKIVLAIVRQTEGYHLDEAPMSSRFIEKMTNIDHRNVERYIKQLLEKKIIFQRTGEKMKWGKKVYIYWLNKNLCRPLYGSEEDCRTEDGSTAVNNTAETAVNDTPNKDINIIYKKEIQEKMDKLKNYKKGT
jgi:phage replication protein O, N-terminal domain